MGSASKNNPTPAASPHNPDTAVACRMTVRALVSSPRPRCRETNRTTPTSIPSTVTSARVLNIVSPRA